jgi:hypothetical protein
MEEGLVTLLVQMDEEIPSSRWEGRGPVSRAGGYFRFNISPRKNLALRSWFFCLCNYKSTIFCLKRATAVMFPFTLPSYSSNHLLVKRGSSQGPPLATRCAGIYPSLGRWSSDGGVVQSSSWPLT